MPLNKHFGGHGAEVMKNMKAEYGEEKGEKVFYATENKRKGKRESLKALKKHAK